MAPSTNMATAVRTPYLFMDASHGLAPSNRQGVNVPLGQAGLAEPSGLAVNQALPACPTRRLLPVGSTLSAPPCRAPPLLPRPHLAIDRAIRAAIDPFAAAGAGSRVQR